MSSFQSAACKTHDLVSISCSFQRGICFSTHHLYDKIYIICYGKQIRETNPVIGPYRPIFLSISFSISLFVFCFPFSFLFLFFFPFPTVISVYYHISTGNEGSCFFLKHGQHCEVITRTLVSLCSSSYNWSFHSLLMITHSGRYPDNASCASSDAKGHCFTKSCNAWDMLWQISNIILFFFWLQ